MEREGVPKYPVPETEYKWGVTGAERGTIFAVVVFNGLAYGPSKSKVPVRIWSTAHDLEIHMIEGWVKGIKCR